MLGNVLQISSVSAKLDISTVTPILSSHYVQANLQIEKTPGYVDMHSRNITCDIDSSACRADEGLKTARMLMAEYAQQGMVNAQNYTHGVAVEGEMLVQAGKGENVFKEIAKSDVTGEVPSTGIKFIPSERPTITWNMNQLVMSGHPAQNAYNWTTTTWPAAQIERKGKVTITETQKPEMNIEYTGNTNSLYLFNSLDQRA